MSTTSIGVSTAQLVVFPRTPPKVRDHHPLGDGKDIVVVDVELGYDGGVSFAMQGTLADVETFLTDALSKVQALREIREFAAAEAAGVAPLPLDEAEVA